MIIKKILAAPPPTSEGIGCGEGLGPIANFLCSIGKGDTAKVANQLNKTISGIIGFLTALAAIWFFIRFILAGFSWISAGGDKSKIEESQKKITNALIGIILVVASWVIVGLIGKIIGLDILNPGALLPNLGF